ncbi:MAG: GBS Bsp-like repeat-containing protein [Merdimonas faecis]|uniref:GBS Bsp-like repeat-containing protein n=1 Tax=Merdimonas faecis TaxID=1653435 RepID=UPI003990C2BD
MKIKKLVAQLMLLVMLFSVTTPSIVYAEELSPSAESSTEDMTDNESNINSEDNMEETEPEGEEVNSSDAVLEEEAPATEVQNTDEEEVISTPIDEMPVNENTGAINYVSVELPYLEAPAEQNIVVSFGDGTQEITDAKVIYTDTVSNENVIPLFKKEGELFQFSKTFSENEKGVYTLKSFCYTLGGIETVINLQDIGISAMFGVNETYPGYEEAVAEDAIDAGEVEMSVVDIDTNEVIEADAKVEDAIEATAEDVQAAAPSKARKASNGDVVVVLDPGHGGGDPGAIGNGLRESDINYSIAQHCKNELEEYGGVVVYMTRTENENPSLAERVDRAAGWGADAFVSIHINSAGAAATGAEVWYPNSSYRPDLHNQGADLSSKILQELTALGLANRGIKVRDSENGTLYPTGDIADYYGVIKRSKEAGFPGIIIEHAFITNPNDAAKLADDNFRKKMGIADATGIANYFGLSKNPTVEIIKNDLKGICQIKYSGFGQGARIAVWSEENGQDDLQWYIMDNGSGVFDIDFTNHKNSKGIYQVHAYNYSATKLLCKTTFRISTDISNTLNINSDGKEIEYQIQLQFADMPDEVEGVSIPIWHEENQSDIIWHQAQEVTPGVWEVKLKIADYKKFGDYQVHVYADIKDGTRTFLKSSVITVTKASAAIEVKNYNIEKGQFDVVVNNIVSPSGIKGVQVPVWCLSDQSDIMWYEAEKQQDGSYIAHVDIKNHKYSIGEYQIHTYITAGNDLYCFGGKATQNIIRPDMPIQAIDLGETETDFLFQIENVDFLGLVQNVQFAVWSEENGQDDLIWYQAKKNSSGVWEANADIKRHRTAGKYQVHVYATLANGTLKFLGSKSIDITKNSIESMKIINSDDSSGTFEVVLSGVNAKSGIQSVQVPVWHMADQSDIKWYQAELQADGTYRTKVYMSNHNYAIGTYNVHAYVSSKNGLNSFVGKTTCEMTLPNMQFSVVDADRKETNYIAQLANINALGVVRNVEFPTWSDKDGQDDLIWYQGTQTSPGTWKADINIRDHRSAGTYQTHVYVTLSNGLRIFFGKTSFTVSEAIGVSVNTGECDEETGGFDVIVTGVNPASGVENVQIPVWSENDQSDIYWYTAKKQNDGTYIASVDPARHKYNSGTYQIHVYVTMGNGIQDFACKTTKEVTSVQYYTIMGDTTVTLDQMVRYYHTSGHTYPSVELGRGGAPTIESFCQMYIEEANAEGVRAEVAFAQAMQETGWLQFGGIVRIDQFNFAGIGALDGNAEGNCATFTSVREGIRAQVQHLKAYGSTEELNNAQVDPRFHLVKRGVAPYVEWLGINENPDHVGWASAEKYGYHIVDKVKAMKKL